VTTLLSILALGFVLGIRHATDPDHVVAVTTIALERGTLTPEGAETLRSTLAEPLATRV